MTVYEILNLVFIGQIILISIIIPIGIKQRINNLMGEHPPSEFPKLYPVSIETIKYTISTFNILNGLMILIGAAVLAVTMFTGSEELLNWDTQSVLTIYFSMQYIPFIFLGTSGLKYHQMMRQVNQKPQRSAQLKRRNVFDYASTLMVTTAAFTFLIYVMTVIYVEQNPFPGFVGYWNILFVTLLNLFYFIMIQRLIGGKKIDPHQAHEDRMNQISLVVKLLVLASIACNVFLTTNLVLSTMDLRHIGDIIQSLYFSLIAIMASQITIYEPENYDVYRAENNN